jgi:hypothetical protein
MEAADVPGSLLLRRAPGEPPTRDQLHPARGRGRPQQRLVPLTRGQGSAALQFEVEITQLDQLDQFRSRGVGSTEKATSDWMHAFSDILNAPPMVEVLRVDRMEGAAS